MAYNFPGVPAAAMPPMGMLKRPNHIFYINHLCHLSKYAFSIAIFKVILFYDE